MMLNAYPLQLDATVARLKMIRETKMAQLAELQEKIEVIDKAIDLIAFDTEVTDGKS
jgi:hypothetical protein